MGVLYDEESGRLVDYSDREANQKLKNEQNTLRGEISTQIHRAIGEVHYVDKDGFSRIGRGWLRAHFMGKGPI